MNRNGKGLILPDPGRITKAMRQYASDRYVEYRLAEGLSKHWQDFGTPPGSNQKYGKGTVPIYGLSLAPSRLSGINVCRWSTPDCVIGCVAHNGNGSFPKVIRARIAKTKFLFGDLESAAVLLADFFDQAASNSGGRLNTFSDLDWQTIARWLFDRRPDISFYDYTKDWSRVESVPNYSLTYSASERTLDSEIVDTVKTGRNVAVVFDTPPSKALPVEWNGLRVVSGDDSDERWRDPSGVVVGLRAKGKMRTRSKGGMVRSAVG